MQDFFLIYDYIFFVVVIFTGKDFHNQQGKDETFNTPLLGTDGGEK